MWGNVFCLASLASLAFEAVAQTTITVGIDDEEDSFRSITTSVTTSVDPRTCGYINGDPDDAVTCSSSCGLLHVSGRDGPYFGCCDDNECPIRTTCIESGTASGRFTLECTEGSLSRCQTWTWPDLSAKAYVCGESRATSTVATETTTGAGTTTDDVGHSTGGPIEPTKTSGGDDNNDDDDGSPGIGWEHDLDSRQRVGAGIGSGVIGGLLLIFFGIFGCWRGPERRESQHRNQRQDTEQSEVHLPGKKATMKRRATDRVTMEQTQASASWTSSPIIQSPQPIRPQPPFYPTSDMPGSSMGYRNPQYQ